MSDRAVQVDGVLPGLLLGADGYDRRRRDSVWQSRVPERYPASIVEVTDLDVARSAIEAARRAGKTVSVISSGHSYIAAGVQDDVVLLDLRRLAHIEVDVRRGTARVGPAVTNGQLDERLEAVGLAFPIGHSPTVGIGGYLLGGGLGWNPEGWGTAACCSVLSAEILCADGRVVTVSEHRHPELFFALRGAGPCFPGVVLEFELALRTRPRAITDSTWRFPLQEIDRIAEWFERVAAEAVPDVERSVSFFRSDGRALIAVSALAFADDDESADRMLAPIGAGLPHELVESSTRRSVRLRDLLAENDDRPARYAVDGAWTTGSSDVLRACAEALRSAPSANSLLHVSVRNRRDDVRDMAFSAPGPVFVFTSAVWDDVEDDAVNTTWQQSVTERIAPYRAGSYINEVDYVSIRGHLDESFDPVTRARLRLARRHYDPGELFAAPGA